MSKKPRALADQLRAAICESGLTHYRLAELSGVAAAVLSRFASGERDIRLETAGRIADVLGLELRPKRG